jgi:hypothetical protein
VYHLQSRPLYRAIGQEDNRNRRATSPALIARKLMLLDLVIGEPQAEWYVTEAEKVALFTEHFRVPVRNCPFCPALAILPMPSFPFGKIRRSIGLPVRAALFSASVWRSSRRRRKSR